MAKTYDPIATQTLGSAVASVTFSSIPATYTDLVLVCNARSLRASDDSFYIKINGDTGANYSTTKLYGNGTTVTSSRDSSATFGRLAANFVANNSAAGTFGPIIIHLNNYSNATTNKTILSRQNYAGGEVGLFVNLWRSTAAITSIDVYAASANLAIGSTFTLYGIKAA